MENTEMKNNIKRLFVAFVPTLAIMWIVPLPIYGVFSTLGALEMPEVGSTARFFLSVSVIKIGFALAFVLLFDLASATLAGRWWPYAAIWWLMFALLEAGRAIGPGSSVPFAVAGVISEAIYFPLSSLVVARLLSGNRDVSESE